MRGSTVGGGACCRLYSIADSWFYYCVVHPNKDGSAILYPFVLHLVSRDAKRLPASSSVVNQSGVRVSQKCCMRISLGSEHVSLSVSRHESLAFQRHGDLLPSEISFIGVLAYGVQFVHCGLPSFLYVNHLIENDKG